GPTAACQDLRLVAAVGDLVRGRVVVDVVVLRRIARTGSASVGSRYVAANDMILQKGNVGGSGPIGAARHAADELDLRAQDDVERVRLGRVRIERRLGNNEAR